jgi:hypothetical protein
MAYRSAASRDHTPNGKAALGVHLERRIAHLLLHFKSSRLSFWILGDGFVNVSSHRLIILQLTPLFHPANTFEISGYRIT